MLTWFRRRHRELVPIGLDEFNQWTREVIALTRLPYNDSMRFAVSTIVLESKELLTKQETATRLEKAAQNQLAAFVFQDVKTKQMAKKEAPEVNIIPPSEVASERLENFAENLVPET